MAKKINEKDDPEVDALLAQGESESSPATKQEILKQRRELWQNTIIAAQIDFQIATRLCDEQMKTNLRQQVRRALDALDELKKIEQGELLE